MELDSTKQLENKDPFLQRAVEYWLDSANELGYQPLFCEWLITQGYVLKYSIKNTHFEQGKDVVAVAKDGTPHAYQLKGSNINLKRWREEVKPEIEALIGCVIQHPDIPKDKPHISYLVTNGEIEDNVRVEIVGLNEGVWKNNPLYTLARGDLLNGFQGMAEGILPKDAQTYKRLMDLIFSDGIAFPDIPKLNSFLSDILNIKEVGRKKEQRKRDIAAAMLYTTMIVGSYRKVENHASVVRIMTLLASLILFLVDKYKLEDKYWLESYQIVWTDIVATAKFLEEEVNHDGFDSAFKDPFDTDLIPLRKHSASSVIYSLKLSQFISDDEDWKSMLVPDIALKYKGSIAVWGEGSLIHMFFLPLIFKNIADGEKTAITLLQTGVNQIIYHNGRKSKLAMGLVSPYYDLDFVIKFNYNLLEQEFEDKSKGDSYFLKPFIEMLVRMDQREFLSEQWQDISFMHFEEFILADPVDYYLWRIDEGENRTLIPKKEKSWAELCTEAQSFEGKTLPGSIKRFPAFIPFFLTLFPYRLNSDMVGFLFKICTK